MCDVHLIEQGRDRRDIGGRTCCYCGTDVNGLGAYVWGELDDGSPGTYIFVYHDDCYELMQSDIDDIEANDGCFMYGVPIDVIAS